MRKAWLVWVATLCICGVGQAGPVLSVSGDKTVPAFKIVRLQAESPAKDSAILWDVVPIAPLTEDVADVMEIDGQLFFTGPPGKYRVTCSEITIVGTKPVVRRTRTTVEIVGAGPNPNPEPSPGPGPQPSPITKQGYFIIIVEETAQAASNRAANFVDSTLKQRIKDNGHKWLVFDKDVVDGNGVRPRDLVFYLDKAAGKPLPRLFLVGLTDSKIHFEGDAPKTAAELVTLLGKVGG